MSEYVAWRTVTGVRKHPNADSLAIVTVGRFNVVHTLSEAEKLKKGEKVIHVPTDICISPSWADRLGVSRYCKIAPYRDGEKARCRIAAARLRGVPSYGFIITNTDEFKGVEDLDDYLGVWKYEPPAPQSGSDVEMVEYDQFPTYTKIRRIQLHPEAWVEGLPIVVTEKLHGMNCRIGVVKQNGDWRYMVGSHHRILKDTSPFWNLLDAPVMELLNFLCDGENPVVLYGERIGKSVQDLDYGYDTPRFRVFDIMVDGEYLDWDVVKAHCESFKVLTVPVLYEGTFSWCMVENMTDGGSVEQNPSVYQSQFKGREGIVIKPIQEAFSEVLGGRLIAKSISVDYESRGGETTEYH